jgi:hypothetical protein
MRTFEARLCESTGYKKARAFVEGPSHREAHAKAHYYGELTARPCMKYIFNRKLKLLRYMSKGPRQFGVGSSK